jgi:hypothetical protein
MDLPFLKDQFHRNKLAKAVYNYALENFNKGVSMDDLDDLLKTKFKFDKFDPFDWEHYYATVALFYWEVGYEDKILLRILSNYITREVSLLFWKNKHGEVIYQDRKRLLHGLLHLLGTENKSPLKPVVN